MYSKFYSNTFGNIISTLSAHKIIFPGSTSASQSYTPDQFTAQASPHSAVPFQRRKRGAVRTKAVHKSTERKLMQLRTCTDPRVETKPCARDPPLRRAREATESSLPTKPLHPTDTSRREGVTSSARRAWGNPNAIRVEPVSKIGLLNPQQFTVSQKAR